MNYEPTNWKTGDLISSTRLNHIEQGIASLYPQEVVIAPEQTVTITAETDVNTGVPITLVDGQAILRPFPDNWAVFVNGVQLGFSDDSRTRIGALEDGFAVVGTYYDDESNLCIFLSVVNQLSESALVIPGDYRVKIVVAGSSKGLFTVKPGTGNVKWYIDAPIADVDDAYASGLVRLQFQTKENADGQFGIVINLSAGDSLGVLYCVIPSGGDACTWYYQGFFARADSDRYEWRGES